MDIKAIINLCLKQQVKLQCKDGKLGVTSATGAISSELVALLKSHKQELIEWLESHERMTLTAVNKEKVVKRSESDPNILSFNQKRLWFFEQLEGHSVAYNIPFILKIKESIDPEHLQNVFAKLITKHQILRTCYFFQDDAPQATLIDANRFNLSVVDLSHEPPHVRKSLIDTMIKEHISTQFDLAKDFMLKAKWIGVDEHESLLLLCLHHIAGDAWSINILIQEFVALYSGRLVENFPHRSSLQYADYAAWEQHVLQGDELTRHLTFWREKLSNLPKIHSLPLDYPRPVNQSYHGATVKTRIDASLKQTLVRFARQHSVSEFMVLQTAFACLLHRYSAETDIVIGTPVANRNQSELTEVVGYFANTLVLRNIFVTGQTFAQTLQLSKEYLLAAYDHQLMPFDKIVEELKPERNLGYAPIFQIMLVMQNGEQAQVSHDVLQIEPVEIEVGTVKFDLLLEIVERHGGYDLHWKYAIDLFAENTIEQLAAHFINLFSHAIDQPEHRVDNLSLMSAPEIQMLQDSYNQTTVTWPTTECLHSTFEHTVACAPSAIALVDGEQVMTYQELNTRANQVAHFLMEEGVRAKDKVGLHLHRSFDLFVAILSVMKVGAAYVPFDPDFPEGRLTYLLKDAQPKLILSQDKLVAALDHLLIKKICIDTAIDPASWSAKNPSLINIGTDPDQLAYILYTSGSTGEPKGVMCSHRAIASRIYWMQSEYQLTPNDVMLQKTPYSFDVSLWELLWPLMYGSKIILAEPGGHLDPVYLRKMVESSGVTILHLVPTMLQAIMATDNWPHNHSLRYVFCAGEALLPHTVQRFYQLDTRTQLVNRYGPTEAPAACHWPCTLSRKDGKIPIGRPTSNTLVYVLDSYRQLVPRGVMGELYLGGTGLADGYLNLTRLTAERFIANPYGEGRLYKTGDLVRWLNDGTLEFIGRTDNQIKLRGYRIELGEIEQALASMEWIEDAAVVVRGTPARLIGYVKKSHHSPFSLEELTEKIKQQLRHILPDYMVPANIMFIDQWPTTTSGKIDRNALPDVASENKQEIQQAETEIEKILQTVWAEVLNIPAEQLGIEQNFFELGGDSILSIQVVAKAAKKDLHFSVRDVFKHPRIHALARNLSNEWVSQAEQEALSGELIPLPIYQRFISQEQRLNHYNQAVILSVPKTLSVEILTDILAVIVNRHDALRLRVDKNKVLHFSAIPDANTLAQFIHRYQLPNLNEQVIASLANEAQRSLNIENGPIMKLVLFNDDHEQRLLWIIHHIAVDGVSWRILLEDLTSLWLQYEKGQHMSLPLKTCSIRQWTESLALASKQELLLSERSYWLEQNNLVKLFDSNKAPTTTRVWGNEQFLLEADVTARLLGEASLAYNSKINELLLSAWFLALTRWSGRDTLSLTLESHGRDTHYSDVDVSQTVGWFTTHYPFSFSSNSTQLAELIPALIATYRRIPGNGVGYGLLTHMTTEVHQIPSNLPDIVFNYLGQFDQTLSHQKAFDFSSEPMGDFIDPDYQERFCISFTSLVHQGQLRINMDFDTTVLSAVSATQLMNHLHCALKEVVLHCCEKLTDSVTDLRPIPVFPVVRYLIKNQNWLAHFNTYDFYAYQPERVNLTVLEKTLSNVVNAHTALRVRIHYEQGQVSQFLAPAGNPGKIISLDLRELSTKDALVRLNELVNMEQRQFVLKKTTPLYRFVNFLLPEPMGNRLLLIFHHMIVDGDSRAIIRERLLAEYQAIGTHDFSNRKTSDYVAWVTDYYKNFDDRTFDAELTYWRSLEWNSLAKVTHLKDQDVYESLQGAAEQLEFELVDAGQVSALASLTNRQGKAMLFDVLLYAELKAMEPFLTTNQLLVETVNDNRTPNRLYPSSDGLIGNLTSNDVYLFDMSKWQALQLPDALEELQRQRTAQQGIRQASLMGFIFGDSAKGIVANVEEYLPWVGINLFINWGQGETTKNTASVFEWATEYGGDKESRSLVGVRAHAFFVHIELCNEGLVARLHPDLCRLQNEKVHQVLRDMRRVLSNILETLTGELK